MVEQVVDILCNNDVDTQVLMSIKITLSIEM